MPTLVDDASLERSHVVANARINRARRLSGINSYERELGFDPLAWLRARAAQRGFAAWLDLCCGSGRARIEAASAGAVTGDQITFRGVGADDTAGPNRTGQEAVDSYYVASGARRAVKNR